MTSLGNFTLLEEQPPSPASAKMLWEIVAVEYGRGTGWELAITMESDGQFILLTFANVVSFRAQDEGNMLEYWPIIKREGVAVGTIYEIGRSTYKDEFQANSVAGIAMPLTHYLVAGNNLCVEPLTGPDDAPTMSAIPLT